MMEYVHVAHANIQAERRQEDPDWFEGVSTSMKTKTQVMRESAKGRVRGYLWKTKEFTEKMVRFYTYFCACVYLIAICTKSICPISVCSHELGWSDLLFFAVGLRHGWGISIEGFQLKMNSVYFSSLSHFDLFVI